MGIKRLYGLAGRLNQVVQSEGRIQKFLNDAIRNEIKDDLVVRRREELDKPKTEPGDND